MCASFFADAQNLKLDFILGQYDHSYNVNGEFNQIITKTSNTTSNMDYVIGVLLRTRIKNNLSFSVGIINYSTFIETMSFWDTTEDQIFEDWVRKTATFSARTYSFPLRLHYEKIIKSSLTLELGAGVEYFAFNDKESLGAIDLGSQHPRLNDFLPRIDQSFFNNRFDGLFSIGLRYKRIGIEFVARTNQNNTFDSFIFEGETFQPNFDRKIWSYALSYSFIKFG